MVGWWATIAIFDSSIVPVSSLQYTYFLSNCLLNWICATFLYQGQPAAVVNGRVWGWGLVFHCLKVWTSPFFAKDHLPETLSIGFHIENSAIWLFLKISYGDVGSGIYIAAFYFCSYTMTSVGYGDIGPQLLFCKGRWRVSEIKNNFNHGFFSEQVVSEAANSSNRVIFWLVRKLAISIVRENRCALTIPLKISGIQITIHNIRDNWRLEGAPKNRWTKNL